PRGLKGGPCPVIRGRSPAKNRGPRPKPYSIGVSIVFCGFNDNFGIRKCRNIQSNTVEYVQVKMFDSGFKFYIPPSVGPANHPECGRLQNRVKRVLSIVVMFCMQSPVLRNIVLDYKLILSFLVLINACLTFGPSYKMACGQVLSLGVVE